MILSESDLSRLCAVALSAARKAGAQIAARAGDRVVATTKETLASSEASQIVTEVDLEAEAIVLAELTPTLERFDLGILTEEQVDDGSRLVRDHFWCADPLDGTLPFTEGAAGYAVSVALVRRDGVPLIGVVYDPLEQTAYHAVRGQGAYRDGEPWVLPPPDTGARRPLTLLADRSLELGPDWDHIQRLLMGVVERLGLSGLRVVAQGGAVMNALWVLESAPALYVKAPKRIPGGVSLWDFAATACVFEEMGAPATDIHGAPLDLNRADSTFMNHRGSLYASDRAVAAAARALLVTRWQRSPV